MKKIVTIILTIITIPTYSSTMCVKNDSVAVVLDPSIIGTTSGYNYETKTWWTQFSFGRVTGTAVMINKSCNGKYDVLINLTDIDNNGNEKRIVGGEEYGKVCWCKTTHPAVSGWVCSYLSNYYFNPFDSENCLKSCGKRLGDYYHAQELEQGLFGSIEN